ncbi:hypothetical protein EDD86DRAFT_214542 [Gorgonomyces haynaldii]|nr:hypothetical protein EDD86DRAFT_214542 [Gorgonomyces haynaldii]
MPSFLFRLCDYHLCYLGCSNASSFATTDTVLLVLHLLTFLGFLGFVVTRHLRAGVLKDKKIKDIWNDMDTMAVLGGLANLFRVLMLVNLRHYGNLDISNMTDTDAQVYVRMTIILEHIQLILAPLGLSAFINTMVKIATGASLFEPIKIGSRLVDVSKALKIFRLLVLLTNIVLVCLFCTLGLDTLADFVLYRRAYYLFPTGVSLLVSLPLLIVFGSKVISAFVTQSDPRDQFQFATTANGKSTAGQDGILTPRVSETARKNNENIRKQKLALVRGSIYGIMAMYISIAALFVCQVFVNEQWSDNHETLFRFKVVLETHFWIHCTWFVFVLYPRI